MAIFGSKSAKDATPSNNHRHEKMQTSNMHDPILSAVNEAQPFEQAADHTNVRRPSYLSQDSAEMKDIFGQPIRQADMSNPTRARNERPMDTIRGFEYAITGDYAYRDQLETQRLGWGFHEDFPYYNMGGQREQNSGLGYERPVINFDEQPMYQKANYSATSLKEDKTNKKKKKGLFGRKK